jgi:nucleoside-diphosphate-sugar epimerase
MPMRVMVVGGNGFLGAHIVRQLVEKEHTVSVFDTSPINRLNDDIAAKFVQIQGDVTDPAAIISAVKKHTVECVVHLASMVTLASQNNPVKAYRLNVGGLLNTLEAARIMGIKRLVYASSLAVYGKTAENIPVHESLPMSPVSLYGATKVFCEELCKAYQKNYQLDFAVIRFPAMWGPGQGQLGGKSPITGSGKFADIIELPARGIIPKISGATQAYDLLYVKDAARLVILALLIDHMVHHFYNAGTGKTVTMPEIGTAIKEVIPIAEFNFEEGFDFFSVPCRGPMDIKRAEEDLGYTPKYSLREAVLDYLQYLEGIGN